MAKFSTTTTVEINCPKCGGDRIVKIGRQSGVQRYRCKDCPKDFRANGKAEGRRMDAEMMGSAIRDFYTGKSYKQIAEGLKEEYDIPEPSKATIYEWVRDYTDEAKEQTADLKAEVGDEWVADEMAVKVGGWQMWNFNVMDTKTRYILASHLSRTRTLKATVETMEKAKAAAGKDPNTIKTDKMTSYRPPSQRYFPRPCTSSLKVCGQRSTTTCRSGCREHTGAEKRLCGDWTAKRAPSGIWTAGR